jgi:hypothetical protein
MGKRTGTSMECPHVAEKILQSIGVEPVGLMVPLCCPCDEIAMMSHGEVLATIAVWDCKNAARILAF